jgi:hypothetical protein
MKSVWVRSLGFDSGQSKRYFSIPRRSHLLLSPNKQSFSLGLNLLGMKLITSCLSVRRSRHVELHVCFLTHVRSAMVYRLMNYVQRQIHFWPFKEFLKNMSKGFKSIILRLLCYLLMSTIKLIGCLQ